MTAAMVGTDDIYMVCLIMEQTEEKQQVKSHFASFNNDSGSRKALLVTSHSQIVALGNGLTVVLLAGSATLNIGAGTWYSDSCS